MIPSLARDASLVQRSPEWPTWPQPDIRLGGALYEARPGFRKLVVLADADVLFVPGGDALTPAAVLTGLLTHPYIDVFRYRDGGPYADAPREPYGPPEVGLSLARGWAELLPADDNGVRGVLYLAGSLVRDRAVFGAGIEHARGDTGSVSYRECDPVAAAEQRGRDVLAAEVAQAVGADLFITERPYLFELPASAVPGVTACRVAEALGVVGLYLRSARFVHILLGLPVGNRHRAGWQRQTWRATVASKDRLLAGLFEPGTQLAGALTVLSKFRNTVHDEMIRATMMQHGWTRDAPIRLPSEHEKEILDCMDAAGGQSAWGVRAAADKSVVMDPAPFVEQIFPTVVACLNAVMEHTPGIISADQPQSDAAHRWYSERNRMSIRWQLGL